MHIDDFDYHLPGERIAQQPAEPRDICRLMVLTRGTGRFGHVLFRDLPRLLRPGDRLVFNNTRVVPARVHMRKVSGGRVELFFLERHDEFTWKALVRPGRRMGPGTVLILEENHEVRMRITGSLPDGERLIRLEEGAFSDIQSIMNRYGHMPLPHYISRVDGPLDREAYQTVYAEVDGAVAAPTAGLHFTSSLIDELRNMGVGVSTVTLHVGPGTFRPVKVENPADHRMHEERYVVTPESAEQISRTRAEGGRIIAVGTTVVRVLEHSFSTCGRLVPSEGTTGIMILPPYRFGMVDGLITNFHLPRSTLIMLTCAFGGRELVLSAYREAVERSYRFYSYGDAMLIL